MEALPGGTTWALNDVLATQSGLTRADQGAIDARGNFAGLQGASTASCCPPRRTFAGSSSDAQIVERADVILAVPPAEHGDNVAGAVDVQSRAPVQALGEAQFLYGERREATWAEAGDFRAGGPCRSASPAVSGPRPAGWTRRRRRRSCTTGRTTGTGSCGWNSAWRRDRLQLLAAYGQTHYQIPIDPTLSPLSAAPPGAVRAPDRYGNQPPDFVPLDADPTESELDLLRRWPGSTTSVRARRCRSRPSCTTSVHPDLRRRAPAGRHGRPRPDLQRRHPPRVSRRRGRSTRRWAWADTT